MVLQLYKVSWKVSAAWLFMQYHYQYYLVKCELNDKGIQYYIVITVYYRELGKSANSIHRNRKTQKPDCCQIVEQGSPEPWALVSELSLKFPAIMSTLPFQELPTDTQGWICIYHLVMGNPGLRLSYQSPPDLRTLFS